MSRVDPTQCVILLGVFVRAMNILARIIDLPLKLHKMSEILMHPNAKSFAVHEFVAVSIIIHVY